MELLLTRWKRGCYGSLNAPLQLWLGCVRKARTGAAWICLTHRRMSAEERYTAFLNLSLLCPHEASHHLEEAGLSGVSLNLRLATDPYRLPAGDTSCPLRKTTILWFYEQKHLISLMQTRFMSVQTQYAANNFLLEYLAPQMSNDVKQNRLRLKLCHFAPLKKKKKVGYYVSLTFSVTVFHKLHGVKEIPHLCIFKHVA